MTAEFEGRTAIVTGAGSGNGRVPSIGEAIAQLLARRGASVVIADIDEQASQHTADIISDAGGNAVAVCADLTSETECEIVAKTALDRFGRIDILVNNVGIGKGSVVTDLVEADFDVAVSVNLKTAMFMAKATLPHMSAEGSVVNLSTTAVLHPTASLAYSATKAAMEALTAHIALQFGPDGIRCNTVRPGEVWTAMVDRNCPTDDAAQALQAERAKRVVLPYGGNAWDIAELVAFLAGPGARWITGQTISVDGGAPLIRPNPDWKAHHSYWKAPR
ncbi:SDR family NAD(P)-dependent oxidoreductase [Novosphingobium lindaniclasticum]|uniref:Short-chain dehydrogenase n=1 Tax=Novosphingobium lindaniclasticum LE124 TaxID=1096930 RepID=T0IXF3_9SPHN|nr:SDR family NAD(P)-dependent oxidoreductase [Novosphingobium lindaniclasticum]EQB14319.1 hypothetical protein L284_13060 [Novosphingobium lindaniclasticum LE124]